KPPTEKEDMRHWWAVFDAHIADWLRRDFLEPLKERSFPTRQQQNPEPRAMPAPSKRGILRRLRRRSISQTELRSDLAEEGQDAPSQSLTVAVENAAWEGNWQFVFDAGRELGDLASSELLVIEAVASAAWYLGHKSTALEIWSLRIQQGSLRAHRFLEAAEL